MDAEQTFDCREPNCTRKVKFVRRELPGSVGFQTRKTIEVEVDVYLECEDKHIHPYKVRTSRNT